MIDINYSIVAAAILSPIVVALISGHEQRKSKREDWRRQDELADKAERNATLLLTKQEDIAAKADTARKLLALSTEKVAVATAITNVKLDTIHTIVNSNMTAAMQSELDATTRELALMKEIIELKRLSGVAPSIDAMTAVTLTEARIAELTTALADRRNSSS